MQPSITQFRTYIQQLITLNDEEWHAVEALIEIKEYHRKDLFHMEGEICKKAGFILQGCFRSVKDIEGEERTFDFAVENEFVTDYYSILTNSLSEFNIIAVEDSVVAVMDAQQLLRLFDGDRTWQKFGRHVAEQTCCYYQQRLLSAFFDAPKKRYEKLLAESPDIILRVPQHIIANYLGVTKETLSRIRKKMSR